MEPVLWVDDVVGLPDPYRWAWGTQCRDWSTGVERRVFVGGNEPSKSKANAAAQAAVPAVKRSWAALVGEGGE